MGAKFKGRREDRRLVTGQGRYTADWDLPGQAHAAFVRADRAHALITRIDTAEAAAAPGVIRVMTGADIAAAGYRSPQPMNFGPGADGQPIRPTERPALAIGRVRFAGEPVALVIAETADQAADAAEMIAIDYDELPVVTRTADALAEGAAQVHDTAPGNVAFLFENGDKAATDAQFAKAAQVIKVSLEAPRIAGVPMEPKACLAAYDAAGGTFDIYMQTQGIADLRNAFAYATGLTPDRFRIHAQDVGGGFGVRNEIYPENAAIVLAARLVGRPVKWTGSRSETIVSDHHGRGVEMTGELAIDAAGGFLALRIDWVFDMGAYCSNAGPLVSTVAAPRSMAGNIYRVPAVHARHRLVLTNLTPTCPYRGANRPNVSYLWERLVDEAARATGLDRVEIRRRNLLDKSQFPYKTPTGAMYDCADPATLVDAALAAADWNGFSQRRAMASARGRLRGIGLATFIEPSGAVGAEEIAIRFRPDGTMALYSNAGPSGQGYESVYPEIVANVLGLDADQMELRSSDPFGPVLAGTGSFGSRSLISHGAALHQGAVEVVEKAKEHAARRLEVSKADLEFAKGRFTVKGTDLGVSMADLVQSLTPASGAHPLDTQLKASVASAFPSGAHVAEVEVDPETGEIAIVHYVAVDDCGIVYNHKIVEGQMRGGIMQGVGQVMGEHCIYDQDSGQILTGSFMDYVMPRADMQPRMTLIEKPVPSPANPLGAKGAGEAGATGAVPTVVNAVIDALSPLGVKEVALPLSPGRVWAAIRAART